MSDNLPPYDAAEERTEDLPPSVEVALQRAAKHGFVQLLGILERMSLDAAPIGGKGPASKEAIRIRHDPSLAFMPNEVVSARALEPREGDTDQAQFEITTAFLGLTGSVSPVPSYISEEVLEDSEQGQAKRDFLDVFHHRLLSLFYRAARKYDFAADYISGARDVWSERVMHLSGLNDAAATLPPETLLRFSPLFSSGAKHSARALEAALADALSESTGGAPLELHQFVPSWVEISDDDLTRLGVRGSTLGRSIVLGKKICDRSSKIDIVIGPISYQQHLAFLSEGTSNILVRRVISAFGQDHFEFQLILLVTNDIPELRLSSKSKQGLGQVTWLHGVGRRDTTLEVKVPLRRDREVEHAR